MGDNAAVLAQSVTFAHSGRTSRNRFLKAPMTEKLCVWSDDLSKRGAPTPEYLNLYEKWGGGEVGVLVSGNIMIHPEHLEAKGNLIIEDSRHLETLKRAGVLAKRNGSLFIGQLSHPGRQTPESIQPHPVSCSDVQFTGSIAGMTFAKPRPLTIAEIEDIINRHANAAEVLHRAGWDGVEIHSAHGYLYSQFLSPRTNKRTDKYGGSLENRSRIIFETVRAIRQRVDDRSFVIGIKINSGDFTNDGFSPEDCQELAKRLEDARIDFIELTGGTYENGAFEAKHKDRKRSTKLREAYFLEFADRMRPHLKRTLLAVSGGFRTSKAMADAVRNNSTDLIGLGRPLCSEPLLCKRILSGEITQARPSALPGVAQVLGSYMQITDMSEGREPTDFGAPASVVGWFVVYYKVVRYLLWPILSWNILRELVALVMSFIK